MYMITHIYIYYISASMISQSVSVQVLLIILKNDTHSKLPGKSAHLDTDNLTSV